MVNKTAIGILVLVILTASIYILVPESVRIDVGKTYSTFKVWENESWVLAGQEYTLMFDGTKKMRASSRTVEQFVDGEIVTIIRTANFKNNVTVIDTYTFDGDEKDIELFPISHEINVLNGQGYILVYEVTKLDYSGETIKDILSPQEFGHNMKIEWEDGNYYSRIWGYANKDEGKLTIKYRPDSKNFTKQVRLFDPPKDIEYTKTTDKTCDENGKCNLVLYSGIRNVYEDDIWKRVEDARSLKNKGFDVVYLGDDGTHKINVIDFNYSFIEFDLSFNPENLGEYEYEVEDGKMKTKFKIIEVLFNETTGEDYEYEIEEEIEIEEEGLNYKYEGNPFGKEFHFGEDSTNIILTEEDSENLEDAYYDDDDARDGTEDLLTLSADIPWIKFRDLDIGNFNLLSVDDAEICVFMAYGNAIDYDIYGVNTTYGNTWSESTLDSANTRVSIFSNMTNFLLSSSTSGSWECDSDSLLNTFIYAQYLNGENMTFAYNKTSVETFNAIRSKENAYAYLRPYLNITYSIDPTDSVLNITSPLTSNPVVVSSEDDITIIFNFSYDGHSVVSDILLNNITIGGSSAEIVQLDGGLDSTNKSCGNDCSGGDYSYPSIDSCTYNILADDCSGASDCDGTDTVVDFWIDKTVYDVGDSVKVIMGIMCYGTTDEVAIWYYNGIVWEQKYYAPACAGQGYFNITTTIPITSNEKIQYIRGQVTYGTLEGYDECFSGTYGENDDISFNVSEALIQDFDYVEGSGWNVNVTVPTFEPGLKDLIVNVSLFGDVYVDTESNSVEYELGDPIYPIFSDYYDDNATLEDTGTGHFNVTVKNTNGTVFLWINNTKIYATNLSADNYNVSYTFTRAGTYIYNWTSYGNGTDNNKNISSNRGYLVNVSYNLIIRDPTTTGPKIVSSGDNITIIFDFQTQGINVTSDVSINNITIGGVQANIVQVGAGAVTEVIDFEPFDADVGGWTQATFDNNDWLFRDTAPADSSNTGPNGLYDGGYMFVETSSNTCNDPDTAVLYLSPEIDFDDYIEVNISFAYNMIGGTMGDLHIKENSTGSWVSHWVRSGDQGSSWIVGNQNFTSVTGSGNIAIWMDCGASYQSDAAIDSVNVTGTSGGITDDFDYVEGSGWNVNVTVPTFEVGLKDLFINVSYEDNNYDATESNAINYGAEDTCTCPGAGNNWEVDMEDNCTLSTDCNLGTGNISWIGSHGYFNLSANLNLTHRDAPPSNTVFYWNIDAKITHLIILLLIITTMFKKKRYLSI